CVSVRVIRVLPDDRSALAESDAHGGDSVTDVGTLGELSSQLDHQADAGRGQRVAERDGTAVEVDAVVIVSDAEVVEKRQYLDGECLVELEQPDVVDAHAGSRECSLG